MLFILSAAQTDTKKHDDDGSSGNSPLERGEKQKKKKLEWMCFFSSLTIAANRRAIFPKARVQLTHNQMITFHFTNDYKSEKFCHNFYNDWAQSALVTIKVACQLVNSHFVYSQLVYSQLVYSQLVYWSTTTIFWSTRQHCWTRKLKYSWKFDFLTVWPDFANS